jgi:hypothetical protein
MIVDRRTFIQGSAFVASTSVLSILLPHSLVMEVQSVQSKQGVEETVCNSAVFKIDGWSVDTKEPDENEVLIRISQSWRTAWR